MTAVEWLTDKFYANEGIMKSEWLEQAKDIELKKLLIAQAEDYLRGYNDGQKRNL